MTKDNNNGMTLIELMIVVAIIGILSGIAVPKFADLMRKAKEASTKGNLGALRSCFRIYYANTTEYPTILDQALVPTYIKEIPEIKLGIVTHLSSSAIEDTSIGGYNADTGGWGYNKDAGKITVNCTHTDTKQNTISTW